MDLLFNKRVWFFVLGGFAFCELISYTTYVEPFLTNPVFIIVVVAFLLLALKDISAALLLTAAELIIGVQGYLFHFDFGGFTLSLRIALWVILVAVGVYKFFSDPPAYKFLLTPYRRYLFLLLPFILYLFLALLIGMMRGNNFGNVFFDANAWLFLFYAFVWVYVKDEHLQYLGSVLAAGVVWLFVKTSVLLYFFSHNFNDLSSNLYLWMRDFRLGEMTYVSGNFWRIFIQSQSMAVICLFVVVVLFFIQKHKLIRRDWGLTGLLVFISGATIMMSYSRSFWLGTAIAGLLCWIFFSIREKFSFNFWKKTLWLVFILSLSAFWLSGVIRFPFPPVDLVAVSPLRSRLGDAAGEAAGGSRLQLLPPLWQAVERHRWFGSGFGTTVTYVTKDPTIVSQTAGGSGLYTTYAFEWGYLDMWLKVGALGLVAFSIFLFFLISVSLRGQPLAQGLVWGFIALLFIHITTPYLNHPLGLGMIPWLIRLNAPSHDPT